MKIEIKRVRDRVVLRLPDKALALSTTVSGGVREVRNVVFKMVDKDFSDDPTLYVSRLLNDMNLSPEDTIVFLTASEIDRSFVMKSLDEFVIASTVSYRPLACVGEVDMEKGGSTINVFILVRRRLSLRSLAELLSLASATKALALSDLCLSCSPTRRALQSAVDAIAVASLGEPPEVEYVGPVTRLGSLVSRELYGLLVESVIKNLDINERLVSLLGLNLEELIDLTLEVYRRAPVPGISNEKVRSIVEEAVSKVLKDPNVWTLMASYKCPEILSSLGWVPNLSREEYLSDSVKIVADEVLGIGLSLYINGMRGLFAYYWIDRNKSKVPRLGDLPPFLDDIASSLIGGILSIIYDALGGQR